jgi:hypothetical protein
MMKGATCFLKRQLTCNGLCGVLYQITEPFVIVLCSLLVSGKMRQMALGWIDACDVQEMAYIRCKFRGAHSGDQPISMFRKNMVPSSSGLNCIG